MLRVHRLLQRSAPLAVKHPRPTTPIILHRPLSTASPETNIDTPNQQPRKSSYVRGDPAVEAGKPL
ncbi:hypothetical protein BGW38_003961, partial [Lunasporangiospora selenospora]